MKRQMLCKKKSKILILGKTPPPYMGPAIATQIILNSALKNHFRLIHVETRLNNDLTNIGNFSAVKIFYLLRQYISFTWKQFLYKPRLVLVPISQSYSGFRKDAVFIRIAHLFNKKVILHLRGSNFLNMYHSLSEERQKKIRKKFCRAEGVIVLGEKLRYIFQPFFPREKIFVVPNGANYTFNSSIQSPSNQPQNSNSTLTLIYLGNLQPSKGILDVIEAYIQLNSSINTQLNIVGKWRDHQTKETVFKLLKNNNFQPSSAVASAKLDLSPSSFELQASNSKLISFHSVLSGQEKINFLTSCDIMIFPPREPEGHPWVIIEAMAAGLPIISTDQGAITESVIDGVNGYIVEKQNPKAIAEKIKFLIENPEIRFQMGNESRKLYEKKFTEEKMVEKLEEVFNSIIY